MPTYFVYYLYHLCPPPPPPPPPEWDMTGGNKTNKCNMNPTAAATHRSCLLHDELGNEVTGADGVQLVIKKAKELEQKFMGLVPRPSVCEYEKVYEYS